MSLSVKRVLAGKRVRLLLEVVVVDREDTTVVRVQAGRPKAPLQGARPKAKKRRRRRMVCFMATEHGYNGIYTVVGRSFSAVMWGFAN
jgi:hypothetical protein